MFEEIIHATQAKKYGEVSIIGSSDKAAREIAANRMPLKYKKAYRIDEIDVKATEDNLKFWEKEFERIEGVPYDRSNVKREI